MTKISRTAVIRDVDEVPGTPRPLTAPVYETATFVFESAAEGVAYTEGRSTAYLYSLMALFFPAIFPASFRGHVGEVGLYFEAAAVITTLVLLIRLFRK